jgi:pyridinium-3,5-biscarboxylic acid mononucleotide synthase
MASGSNPETAAKTLIQPQDLVAAAQEFLAGTASMADLSAAVDRANCESFDGVTLDLDRERRCGFPEVVYAAGKSQEALLEIARRMRSREIPFLATRVHPQQAQSLASVFPDAIYHEAARTVRIGTCQRWNAETQPQANHGAPSQVPSSVAVAAAGTTDLPVAEEACETLAWMGVPVVRVVDIGVAGPQRLRMHAQRLRDCAAIVVVAGMEGALPSAIGGYVACPVFAVPTSVGYGTSLGGLAALLSMLNSCVANVAVVNIDAGFKAAYLAGLVAYRSRS